MLTKHPLRYAHVEGHTDICYAEDGSQIITCGNDGDIRVWTGFEDPDPDSYCVGEKLVSVAQKENDIYVGRDDGRVLVLKYPEGERNGTLTRFTAPATHITVARNESVIACVSEDCTVKVFRSSQDADCVEFGDLKGPALGAALSPNGELLAVSSGDCNIYVWKWEEKKLLKTIECVPRCNVFTSAKVLGRMSFDKTSKYLAYPTGKTVTVVDVENFETKSTFTNSKTDSVYSIVQISPCGSFIAASATNGDLCVWDFESDNLVAFSHNEYSICSMAWHPEERGELSFCDVNGQFGTIEILTEDGSKFAASKKQDNEVSSNQANDIDPENIDIDDEDDENVISLEKLKQDTLGLSAPSPTVELSEPGSRAQSPERPKSPEVNLQPPFQPSSTPVYLSDRFMVYNEIGIVRHFRNEEEECSIDVTFHDATFFKNLYMKNVLNHTMASLSTSVLALACETPSKLVCIPLKTGVKEWSSELTDLEEVLCVASSDSLVAIATNVRMLRIFTTFGSQRALLSIPGPVVSIAAYKTYIFVAYHACTTYSKDQNLNGMLVHLGSTITNKIFPIPITPQSTLTWIGFTDAGSLASYDSAGLLRLCRLQSGAWIPVADTSLHAKGASDSYFMISVSEKSETLRVIHCKGTIYPAAIPLPISLELPMRVPLCEPETDKTQMEDQIFRWSVFETEQPAKAFTETAIKLFALACRNNSDDRAYELLEMLNNQQLVNLGLKYSNKLGRPRLVEKLTELQKKMQGGHVNNENNPNVSIRPILNRRPKPKTQPTQNTESNSEENYSQELFSSNTTMLLSDSQIMTPESPKAKSAIRNPFVKKQSGNQRNPLSLTNSEHDNTFPPDIDVTKEKPTQNNKIEKETFTTWFNSQKQVIEKENPDLSPEAVVKLGIKLFKKQAEKRKAEDEESSQKSKQQKLSAFAFSK